MNTHFAYSYWAEQNSILNEQKFKSETIKTL